MNNTTLQSTEIETLASSTENASPVKRGRGRPAGSNSFEMVQIKVILNLLSPDASIPISKKWLRDTMGLMIAANPITVIPATIPAITKTEEQDEKVQFAIHEFEESWN